MQMRRFVIRDRSAMGVYLKNADTVCIHQAVGNLSKMYSLKSAQMAFEGGESMSTGKYDATSPIEFVPLTQVVVEI